MRYQLIVDVDGEDAPTLRVVDRRLGATLIEAHGQQARLLITSGCLPTALCACGHHPCAASQVKDLIVACAFARSILQVAGPLRARAIGGADTAQLS